MGVVGGIFPWNAALILADADLDHAVDASAFGAFLHQGQICMSARRLLVDRRVADRGLAAVDEFTELRWVTVQSGTRPFPF